MPNAAPVLTSSVKREKRPQTRRLTSAAYSHKWRKCRAHFLAANPFCVFCLETGTETIATQVDHVKAAADHPDLFFEHSNLRSLCGPCHSRRTATEQRFVRR